MKSQSQVSSVNQRHGWIPSPWLHGPLPITNTNIGCKSDLVAILGLQVRLSVRARVLVLLANSGKLIRPIAVTSHFNSGAYSACSVVDKDVSCRAKERICFQTAIINLGSFQLQMIFRKRRNLQDDNNPACLRANLHEYVHVCSGCFLWIPDHLNLLFPYCFACAKMVRLNKACNNHLFVWVRVEFVSESKKNRTKRPESECLYVSLVESDSCTACCGVACFLSNGKVWMLYVALMCACLSLGNIMTQNWKQLAFSADQLQLHVTFVGQHHGSPGKPFLINWVRRFSSHECSFCSPAIFFQNKNERPGNSQQLFLCFGSLSRILSSHLSWLWKLHLLWQILHIHSSALLWASKHCIPLGFFSNDLLKNIRAPYQVILPTRSAVEVVGSLSNKGLCTRASGSSSTTLVSPASALSTARSKNSPASHMFSFMHCRGQGTL